MGLNDTCSEVYMVEQLCVMFIIQNGFKKGEDISNVQENTLWQKLN
jgi:hypothetical protein